MQIPDGLKAALIATGIIAILLIALLASKDSGPKYKIKEVKEPVITKPVPKKAPVKKQPIKPPEPQWTTCPKCNGRGTVTCHICDGKGWKERSGIFSQEFDDWARNKGGKKFKGFECITCRGTGRAKCWRCKGTGKVRR